MVKTNYKLYYVFVHTNVRMLYSSKEYSKITQHKLQGTSYDYVLTDCHLNGILRMYDGWLEVTGCLCGPNTRIKTVCVTVLSAVSHVRTCVYSGVWIHWWGQWDEFYSHPCTYVVQVIREKYCKQRLPRQSI